MMKLWKVTRPSDGVCCGMREVELIDFNLFGQSQLVYIASIDNTASFEYQKQNMLYAVPAGISTVRYLSRVLCHCSACGLDFLKSAITVEKLCIAAHAWLNICLIKCRTEVSTLITN
jgi:hypothetical protein